MREELGLQRLALSLLHRGYNDTYQLGRGKHRLALRINRQLGSRQALAAEVAWMEALGEDTRVTACMDLPTVKAWGHTGSRGWLLASWLPGVQRGASLSPRMLYAVGRATAALHLSALGWSPPGWARPTLDQAWGGRPCPPLSPEHAALFHRCTERLQPILETLCEQPRPLHADLHQGNYRFRAGLRLGVLDFDDCAWGHPAQDLAITLYYLRAHPRFAALRDAHKAGYESLTEWPTDPDLMASLHLWRGLTLLAAVSQHSAPQLRARIPGLLPKWTRMAKAWLSDK